MIFALLFLLKLVDTIKLPGSCSLGEFYEPSLMQCLACPHNVSLTTSKDGFSCSCEEHSIPIGIAHCKPCNVTEVVSADGGSCVPRRCQTFAGRVACRKCPRDYITVTQNFDGSPMKEVQCIKCARGFRSQDNKCVKCESCSCNKHEVIVAGKCVPKKFLLDRPQYTENKLHPTALLEIVKLEYLCTEHDLRACRALGSACARNFYTVDAAGPCRLWLKPNMTIKGKKTEAKITYTEEFEKLMSIGMESYKDPSLGLPLLVFPLNKNGDDVILEPDQNSLNIVLLEHTSSGGIKILQNSDERYFGCLPPNIKIGDEFSCGVVKNVTNFNPTDFNNTYEIYVSQKKDLKLISINFVKNGRHVQSGLWPSDKFRKFFLIKKYLSIITNISEVVYLRTLLLKVSITRGTSTSGSLKLQLNIEAQYENKSPLTDIITTTFKVHHQMPEAGVIWSLEILGGLFGSIMVLYSMVQWRGSVRRGAPQYVVVPILASGIADALYFATLLSTLHALAAEAGTLGLTLPLSNSEERLITALLYTVISLKALKIAWMNLSQCRCSVLFIDWSKYNLSSNDIEINELYDWRTVMVVKEWTSMLTKRRVSPGFTVTLSLLVIHLLDSSMSNIPKSQGYKWALAAISWWSSYTILLLARYIMDMVIGAPTANIQRVCCGVGVSLLIFQEEKYAHYVNGRNEDMLDIKTMSDSLTTCRLFCSLQLREIYTKLSTSGYGDFGQDSNKVLLSRFMAAFFERALDGLNWVACERTILERLLDVELVAREGGSTSILLYDEDKTPSCFAVTWWGQEWLLATFDAMLFDSVYIASGQPLLAALTTLITWQTMKLARNYFGSRNLRADWSATKSSIHLRF